MDGWDDGGGETVPSEKGKVQNEVAGRYLE
jgi:hypothetical protein